MFPLWKKIDKKINQNRVYDGIKTKSVLVMMFDESKQKLTFFIIFYNNRLIHINCKFI